MLAWYVIRIVSFRPNSKYVYVIRSQVLSPDEKPIFEKIKTALERATNDIFPRPDVAANIDCVDLINATSSPSILTEVSNSGSIFWILLSDLTSL